MNILRTIFLVSLCGLSTVDAQQSKSEVQSKGFVMNTDESTIRDGQGRTLGWITENSVEKTVRSHKGLVGRYNKLDNKTYDGQGRFVGTGDQTYRLLK